MSSQTATADAAVIQTLGLTAKAKRRRWLRRLLELTIAIAVVAGGILLWRRVSASAPLRYETRPLVVDDLTVTVTATGTLAPSTSVNIGPEISGLVRHVRADYNDHVEVGQVLVELDTDLLKAQSEQAASQVALAEANLEQARASWADARRELGRAVPLAARGAISTAELDTARSAEVKARALTDGMVAQLRTARAAASVVKTNLSKATIRSPISGTVLSRSVEEGQVAVAALQAPVFFTVAQDLAHMQLVVDVDEADVGTVKAGQRATFTVAAYGDRVFDAYVSSVRNSPHVRENVVTYQTVLEVANPEGLLRPGMTGTARLITEVHHGEHLVPDAALRFHPAGAPEAIDHQVSILEAGRPRAVAVTVGVTDGVRTAVTGNLPDGALVIVDARRGGKK